MQNYSHPFVKHVRHQCKRYGCELKLLYVDMLVDEDDGSTCDGYFREEPLELVVSTQKRYYGYATKLHLTMPEIVQGIEILLKDN